MAGGENEAERADELADLVAELDDLTTDSLTWHLSLGPVHVEAHLPTQRLFWLFVLFHGCAGVGGAVLILRGGRASELGIALVVGALFALGAFMAQVWSHSLEHERELSDVIYGADLKQRIRELAAKASELQGATQGGMTSGEAQPTSPVATPRSAGGCSTQEPST